MQGFRRNIKCIMLSNTDKIATSVFVAAKEVLREILDQTAEMTAGLTFLSSLNDESLQKPFDQRFLNETSQLISTMHRMVSEEEARLKHLQTMQIADTWAEREYDRWKNGRRPVLQSKSVLKN